MPTWEVGFSSGLGPKESKMPSNAMTKCAVGAMLFGGTLGVAQAGVTGVAGNSSSAILSLASNSETYEEFGAYGSPMAGPGRLLCQQRSEAWHAVSQWGTIMPWRSIVLAH
jgi:hypothetical protein